MSKSFLIGNFLPAYGSTFGKIRTNKQRVDGLSGEKLALRFSERKKKLIQRRLQYIILVQVGMAVSLILAIGAFKVGFSTGEEASFQLTAQEVVQMEEIIQTQQVEKPPPPPRPPIPIEVPNDVDLADDELDFDATLDLDQAIADLPPPPPEAVVQEEAPEPEIFVAVEEMPELIGGMPALLDDLGYPELARRASIDGTVVVRVVINPDGKPSDPVILRSVTEVLDNEAVRAVMLQSFVPGKQRGRPVRVYMAIPVVFRLN